MNNLFNSLCQIERETFSSQLDVNPKGGSSYSSSFDRSDARKVNVMISLWSCEEVDTQLGEKDVNLSFSPSSQGYASHDVNNPHLIPLLVRV